MRKLLKICIVFLFCIVLLPNLIREAPQFNYQQNTKNQIDIQTQYGDDLKPFLYFTNIGDFLPWYHSAGSFNGFDDTGDKLIAWSVTIGYGKRPLPQESTNLITNYSIYIQHFRQFVYPSAISYWMLYIYFTDGNFQTIYSSPYGGELSWQGWLNGTFTPSKTLNYLLLLVGGAGVTGKCYVNITDEIYWGHAPTIDNLIYPSEGIAGAEELFSGELGNVNLSASASITFKYVFTGLMLENLSMTRDWTTYTFYFLLQSFTRTGLYCFSITAKNLFNVTTTTPWIYFTIINAYKAYLSLFNSLSGFPLASKDFKIFLGQPDFRECINFRTFYGSWNVLNYNGLVNASLIVNGTYESGELIDNYIAIEACGNGLRSTFENGMIYNTTTYATLEIQIKVLQPGWIVLIYNPAIWEKDFYLEFTSSMVGYWFDVEIPFFNFTTYADITHNLFYELGIWIENATALISNIRVTTHYTWNGTAYVENSYRLASLENRQNPNELAFNALIETLCIQDFYNNTLYISDVTYTPYLDISLPIALMTFYNWENFTALIRIYRGLGTFLEIACPPGGSITTEVFCTHYRVWVANQHLQELFISYISPNQTRNVIVIIGTQQNLTAGQDFWAELWAFLFGTPLGITLFIVIVIALALNIISTIYAFRLRRQLKVARQQKQKQKPGGWTPTVF
jgi:hypothetical protein